MLLPARYFHFIEVKLSFCLRRTNGSWHFGKIVSVRWEILRSTFCIGKQNRKDRRWNRRKIQYKGERMRGREGGRKVEGTIVKSPVSRSHKTWLNVSARNTRIYVPSWQKQDDSRSFYSWLSFMVRLHRQNRWKLSRYTPQDPIFIVGTHSPGIRRRRFDAKIERLLPMSAIGFLEL